MECESFKFSQNFYGLAESSNYAVFWSPYAWLLLLRNREQPNVPFSSPPAIVSSALFVAYFYSFFHFRHSNRSKSPRELPFDAEAAAGASENPPGTPERTSSLGKSLGRVDKRVSWNFVSRRFNFIRKSNPTHANPHIFISTLRAINFPILANRTTKFN